MRPFLCSLIALAIFVGQAPATAQSRLFDASALDDATLEQQRGGFDLPGGMRMTLAVRITTDVNGERLLETLWQLGQAKPGTGSMGGAAGASGVPQVSFRVELPDLLIEHHVGDRIGSLVANSGDGRTIDQQTSVDMRFENVQPLSIGAGLARIQSPGLEAGLLRAGGG